MKRTTLRPSFKVCLEFILLYSLKPNERKSENNLKPVSNLAETKFHFGGRANERKSLKTVTLSFCTHATQSFEHPWKLYLKQKQKQIRGQRARVREACDKTFPVEVELWWAVPWNTWNFRKLPTNRRRVLHDCRPRGLSYSKLTKN